MKKIAEFLVNKRYIVLALIIILAVYSVTLMSKVNVITDLTELLPDDSQMKIGIDVMGEEFAETEQTYTIKVMSTDLDESKKTQLISELSAVDGVKSVDYKEGDEDYNKDNHSLFIVTTDFDYDSQEYEDLKNTIDTTLVEPYNLVTASGETVPPEVPPYIMLLAVAMLMVILFLMCASWVEPFLFLLAIGIAIVINMGTNAYFDGVSETTHSIAAILQLVLSMDYSIILINRYRQELALGKEKEIAMKDAIVGAAAPIASSALTTIVGLLALVFMRFKIGPDMGMVLAKGVLISMIVILTVLPALILMFDDAIKKTEKKVLHIPMDGISNFSYKHRKVIMACFLVFFASVFVLKDRLNISFLMYEYNEIDEVFPIKNQIILLYNNSDEEEASKLVASLQGNEYVDQATSYGATIGAQLTSEELYGYIQSQSTGYNIDKSVIDLIYYNYCNLNNQMMTMTLSEFTDFIQLYIQAYPNLVTEEDAAKLSQFAMFANKEELTKERSAIEISMIFGIDEQMLSQLLQMTGKSTISIVEFLQVVQSTPEIAGVLAQVNPQAAQQMQMLGTIIQSTMADVPFTSAQLSQLLTSMGGDSATLNENVINILYTLYYSVTDSDPSWKMSIEQVMENLLVMSQDPTFASLISDEQLAELQNFATTLQTAKQQLVGENHSLVIITSTLPEESEETNVLFGQLVDSINTNFKSDHYLIGNTPMEYELTMTFDDELTKISIITALAIFTVVMLTFRSAVIPLILISLIQSAVYATMVIMSIMSGDMNFMALLIVQSILMGATTDYAILFTNYYRENRVNLDVPSALTEAYNKSIHTIFTSGLIMVLVTWIVSYAFTDPAIAQICQTISLGSACAITLIIFVLPSILATLDKYTSGIKN